MRCSEIVINGSSSKLFFHRRPTFPKRSNKLKSDLSSNGLFWNFLLAPLLPRLPDHYFYLLTDRHSPNQFFFVYERWRRRTQKEHKLAIMFQFLRHQFTLLVSCSKRNFQINLFLAGIRQEWRLLSNKSLRGALAIDTPNPNSTFFVDVFVVASTSFRREKTLHLHFQWKNLFCVRLLLERISRLECRGRKWDDVATRFAEGEWPTAMSLLS